MNFDFDDVLERWMFGFLAFMILAAVIALLVVLTLPFVRLNNPTEGTKIGRILNLTKEGVFFKTNEVTIIRGGFNNGSGNIGNISHVTATDAQLPILEKALNAQTELLIDYRCPLIYWVANSENGCFITNIRAANLK